MKFKAELINIWKDNVPHIPPDPLPLIQTDDYSHDVLCSWFEIGKVRHKRGYGVEAKMGGA